MLCPDSVIGPEHCTALATMVDGSAVQNYRKLGDTHIPRSGMRENGFLSRSNDPKIHWIYATLLIVSAFLIGIAGFGFAGMGPCGAAKPSVLAFSSACSAAAIYSSILVLTSNQRELRLRTIPFYLAVLIAIAFAGLQALMFLG
ncbi:MAG TPA: hypothetical protein VFU50_04235 [Terriglobales bacterium]|nr:hypothetical protein [Terriglobales bacterium]